MFQTKVVERAKQSLYVQ